MDQPCFAGRPAESRASPPPRRRAGQDDAADILGLERLDRHCHSQIRLASARRPDAERDGIFADGGEIFLLAQRLGVDGTALGRDCDEIVGQLPQALFLAPVGQADAVAHGLLLKRGVVFHQGDHAVHARAAASTSFCSPVKRSTEPRQTAVTRNSFSSRWIFWSPLPKMAAASSMLSSSKDRSAKFSSSRFHGVAYSYTFRLYHSFSQKKL